MVTRNDVINRLKPFVMHHKKVLTAWEGGSAATKSVDRYSDLDLMIVAEAKAVETIFSSVEALFLEHYGIQESMRLPEPTWHGFAQKFYLLKATEPWFYVDLCVLTPASEDTFTAPDRHGNGVVWKDTINFIDTKPTPPETIQKRAKMHYMRATKGTFVLRLEIEKALHRNHYLDAYHFTYSFVMRCLVPLMNIEHRIAKVDFGVRYISHDYTKEDYQLIKSFMEVSTIEALKAITARLFKRYETLKKAYQHFM